MPDGRRDQDPSVGRLADERAALRRVATLVARGVRPGELFSAVSDEVGRLFGAEAAIARFEADGSAMVIVGLTRGIRIVSIGTRWELEDFLASTAVHRTGRPARNDHTAHRAASGHVAESLRQMSFVCTVAAPIVVEGSLWGVMTVSDGRHPLPLDTEERVGRFTELVAAAIANAESRAKLAASEARAHDLAREQAALRRVATLVAEDASVDAVFAAVAQEVLELCGIPVVGVHRFEPDGTFTTVGKAGQTPFDLGSRWPVEADGLPATVRDTGRPVRREDRTAMPYPVGELMGDDPAAATVGAPIMVDGVIWGMIVSAARPGKPIPPGTERRVARFTELVATAIAKSEAQEHLAELADEQGALRRVATAVAHGASPDVVFAQVAEEVGLLLGVELTGIHRFESDRYARVVANWGQVSGLVPPHHRLNLDGGSVTAQVYRTGRPARVDSYESASGPLAEGLQRLGMRAGVGSPIIVNGRLWGAITAVTSRPERLPGDSAARLAQFTELIATAIANVEARSELQRLADEQAALRRVATLVAHGVSPDEIFSSVSNEVGQLFDSDQAAVARYDRDGSGLVVVGVSEGVRGVSIGTRWPLEDFLASTRVFRTGRPTRSERGDFDVASGPVGATLRKIDAVSSVLAPIVVEGDVWGVMAVSDMHKRLPPDAAERLAKFTELVGTAIVNAESRAELSASRARVIAAADEARRRIERDLHDGAQQRLVTLAVALRRAEAKLSAGSDDLRADVTRVAEGLTAAIEELREMSHGVHPSVLTEAGLSPALKALGRRSAVRVKLDLHCDGRLPDQVEVAAYYTVAEALTNAAKHAGATRVWVSLGVHAGTLHLSIRDDGVGGAEPRRGTGLVGLRDRIEALGGRIDVESPPGGGTRIAAKIPVSDHRIDAPSVTPAPARTWRATPAR